MIKSRFNFRWFCTPHWFALAWILVGPDVSWSQGPPPSATNDIGSTTASEQRLYPNGLPKIDVLMKSTIEHHPEVLAARSKLRAAEAELRLAELKALKETMIVRDRWEKANRAVVRLTNATGPSPEDRRDALLNLTAIEWELSFLLGTRGEATLVTKPAEEAVGGSAVAASPTVILDSIIPREPLATLFQESLEKKIEVNFQNQPLSDVVASLKGKTGINFVLDEEMLEEAAIPIASPITANLGDLDLISALQALEDLHRPLYFVIRDYGILVTSKANRSSRTVSVIDFVKLNPKELQLQLQQQRQEEIESQRSNSTGGGMF